MYLELKKEIKEIVEIVELCPEKLQEKCFEMLLNQYIPEHKVEKETNIVSQSAVKNVITDDTVESTSSKDCADSSSIEEIKITDFHIKTQRFFTNNGVTIEDINNLYYKEGGKLMPLYESLGSTKMSECQMRLELLTAFENSYANVNGDMSFRGEEVRQRCQTMKCYDIANFSSIMKKNSNLFDNFNDKYDKNTEYILSTEGKKELAKIIIELAKGV